MISEWQGQGIHGVLDSVSWNDKEIDFFVKAGTAQGFVMVYGRARTMLDMQLHVRNTKPWLLNRNCKRGPTLDYNKGKSKNKPHFL